MRILHFWVVSKNWVWLRNEYWFHEKMKMSVFGFGFGLFIFFGFCLVAVGGSTRRIWRVMNNKMHTSFSFQCLMGSMKRWRRIEGNHIVKVNCFLSLW